MKIAKRKYKMSDATLIQASDDIMGSATRDLAELAAFSIDAAKIAAIGLIRNTFSDTPTDEELMGDLMLATQARNNQAEIVRNAIRPIAVRFLVKFGEQNGHYRALRVDNLSQQTYNDLMRTARAVSRRGTIHLAALASEGLTAAILTDLETQAALLDNLIDAQIDAVKNRDMAVGERIKKGNDLYTAILKLTQYGKSVWFNVNEAKYNDYILNEVAKEAAQVLAGNLNMGEQVNLSASDVKPDTELTVTATGGNVVIYAAENPGDPPNSFQQTINDGIPRTFMAAEIGFATGTRERINLYNLGPGAVSYEVVVEA